jgi:signal transduction histidine kinase
VPKNHGR